jgi:large subunit ribosomal protein L10
MAKIELKQPVVQEIKGKLEASKGAVLTDYRGLNVAEVTELRTKLREVGVEYKVVKNTLARIAANEIGIEGLDGYLEGPTAIAYGIEDAVAPAKVLSEFAKAHKNLEIKAGILEGKVIDLNGVKALADLPSREVLLAKLLGSMQSPLYGMANVLQGNLRNLVYVLDAVRKTKEA